MAGENQQRGNGVDSPVIPLQPIEIIDEDEGAPVVDQNAPHPSDKERAGSYEYDPDGEVDDGKQGQDARLAHFQQDNQGGADKAPAGETPEQLSARQRRRQREKNARERERTELVTLRNENAQLKQGLLHVDARVANVEQAGIDGQISAIEVEIQRAQQVMARAVEAQNGADMATALEIRDQFRDRLAQLKAQKAETTKARAEPTQVDQPRLPNGMTQAQASYIGIFSGRHPWFSQGNDSDSNAVRQLDAEMLAEGKNPSQPAYWVELERRIREDIPHRFQAANDGGKQNNGGQQDRQQQNGRGNGANGRAAGGPKLPGGSGGGGPGAGNGGPVQFHLSKMRKDAMIASGAWTDPAAKERQIRYYMKWDAENPTK